MSHSKGFRKSFVICITFIFMAMPFFTLISPTNAESLTNDISPILLTDITDDELSSFNMASEIENILYQVDEELMGGHIEALQNFGTRYCYAVDECYEAADYIYSVFERNGLQVSFDDFIAGGHPMRNVVAELPGKTTSDKVFIICAHYDSITSNPYEFAPGADDNGSGTAAVMAAAELLSDYEFNYTIRFIAFSGEEEGLYGSYHYNDMMLQNGENICGVVNLDMIAYNPDPGSLFVDMDTAGSNEISEPLADFTESIAEKYEHISKLDIWKTRGVDSSDHAAFWDDFPAFMFIERIFNTPNYHQASDTIDKLNLTYCSNVTQIAIATLAELAELDATDSSPPDHFDEYPVDGGYGPGDAEISIDIIDSSQINSSSIELHVLGSPVIPTLTPTPTGFTVSYLHVPGYADEDIVECNITAADIHGNTMYFNWSFTIDAIPPAPPTNFNIEIDRIEMEKYACVLARGPSEYDGNGTSSPSIIFHDNEYKMWYAGRDTGLQILYANSTNGISWNKHGIVLPHGGVGTLDYAGTSSPSVLYEDGEYKIWYTGDNGTTSRILYANSTDGISWIKQGIALDLGTIGEYDDAQLLSPSVLYEGGEYKIWYTGIHDSIHRILYANSADGMSWNKYGMVLEASQYGEFDTHEVKNSCVVMTQDGYEMYYSGSKYDTFRILLANSTDGINWNKLGMVLDTGDHAEYDSIQASDCTVLYHDDELKIWYSGYDGGFWAILYSYLSDNEQDTDISLSWSSSPSEDIAYYELARSHSPHSFGCGSSVILNGTLAGPLSLGQRFFDLGCTNIRFCELWVDDDEFGESPWDWWSLDEVGTGGWDDYYIDYKTGIVTLNPVNWPTGWWDNPSYIHGWIYCTGDPVSRTTSTSMVDNGIGDEDTNDYYYTLKAVDKAGNTVECAYKVGKVGTETSTGWNLISSPFIEGNVPIKDALGSLEWTEVFSYNSSDHADHWRMNSTSMPDVLDDLDTITDGAAYWINVPPAEVYVSTGIVSNTSIRLDSGWNLISYPYHEGKQVADALAGLPYERVEGFDPIAPYKIATMLDTDIMVPGFGYWIYTSSAATWNIVNT